MLIVWFEYFMPVNSAEISFIYFANVDIIKMNMQCYWLLLYYCICKFFYIIHTLCFFLRIMAKPIVVPSNIMIILTNIGKRIPERNILLQFFQYIMIYPITHSEWFRSKKNFKKKKQKRKWVFSSVCTDWSKH